MMQGSLAAAPIESLRAADILAEEIRRVEGSNLTQVRKREATRVYREFLRYAGDRNPTELLDPAMRFIQDLLARRTRAGAPLARRSLSIYLSTLARVFEDLQDTYPTYSNPVRAARRAILRSNDQGQYRSWKRLTVADAGEILLALAQAGPDYMACWRFLCGLGPRSTEAGSADIGDFTWTGRDEGRWQIKPHRKRWVEYDAIWVDEDLMTFLKAYLRVVRRIPEHRIDEHLEEPLFTNQRGARLRTDSMSKAVRKVTVQLGLNRPGGGPHERAVLHGSRSLVATHLRRFIPWELIEVMRGSRLEGNRRNYLAFGPEDLRAVRPYLLRTRELVDAAIAKYEWKHNDLLRDGLRELAKFGVQWAPAPNRIPLSAQGAILPSDPPTVPSSPTGPLDSPLLQLAQRPTPTLQANPAAYGTLLNALHLEATHPNLLWTDADVNAPPGIVAALVHLGFVRHVGRHGSHDFYQTVAPENANPHQAAEAVSLEARPMTPAHVLLEEAKNQ